MNDGQAWTSSTAGYAGARRWRAAAGAVLLATLLIADLEPPRAQPLLPSFADVVERVAPAVVNISSTREVSAGRDIPVPQFPPGSPFEEFFREFFERERQQRERRSFSLGSGFIIDPAGYVVTNNHVIAEADEITVILYDESEYRARVVGRDPKTDLALLKIERPEPFPYVTWADSDRVRVGDWVIAIGNPFGLGTSVTVGVVSARGRDIRAGPYVDFFQIDAAINRGNSGGPSFTLDGQVFGVNTAIYSPSGGSVGIGFAIPSNLARRVIESLMEKGRVVRGWLGVRIQTVTEDLARALGLERPSGALVADVVAGAPAEEAGILAGDVILEFDGRPIQRMRELPRVVAETPVGEEVEVVVWRRGERLRLRITLGELPSDEELARAPRRGEEAPAALAEVEELGIVVALVDEELRSRFQLPEGAQGVVVVRVDPGAPAAAGGLRPGDVILEVDQEPVGSPPELLARIYAARSQGQRTVLLLIDRGGDLQFAAVPLRG